MTDDDKKPICPIDCSHTEWERKQIVRRENRPEVDWSDPITRRYGHPERYR